MNNSVWMGEMTWPEYAAKLEKGAIMIIPLGALEQHGYHMTLNVDAVCPGTVSERVARAIGGVVAPVVPYGCKSLQRSGGGNFMMGTTSLDGSTYIALIRDILRDFIRHGARKFVMMNGHYENQAFMIEGIDLALRDAKLQGVTDVRAMLISYWDFISDPKVLEYLYPDCMPGWDAEHAGLMETSIMMAVRPELVDLSRAEKHGPCKFPLYDVFPPHEDWTPAPGTLSLPDGSTADKGELILKTCTDGIVAEIKKEFGV